MKTTDETSPSPIACCAAEWFIAHRGGALSTKERSQFTAWLKASPENVQAYLHVAALSREMAAAAKELDICLDDLLSEARSTSAEVVAIGSGRLRESGDPRSRSSLAHRPRSRTRWLAASAIVIGVVLTALWVLGDGERWVSAKKYRTAHAEQGTWRLPDGSVMQLNSDSRVVVDFSKAERKLEVIRGQAHFHVTHDAMRRFRVIAGETNIIALGTEFDVYRRSDATVITVVEGKVAVVGRGKEAPPVGADPNASHQRSQVELMAGQQARVSPASQRPRLVRADIRESTAWLQRQIVFEQKSLAQVADEFNRYSRVPIEIEDAQLAGLRISGVFDAYDTASFVAFLRRLDGVVVEVGPSAIRVISRSATA